MEKNTALAQGTRNCKKPISKNGTVSKIDHVSEICGIMESRINALDWYAEALVRDIHQANQLNYPVSDVHATLVYQQVDSFRTALEEIKGYLPAKEVKA